MAMAVFTPYPGSKLYDELTEEGKIDIFDDRSIKGIIDSYDLWPNKVYAKHISSTMIKTYVFIALISFYASNYLFRPMRLVRTLRNIAKNQHESRLEQILHKNFFKVFYENAVYQKLHKLSSKMNNIF